jgi:hypothetical protein
VSVRAPIEPPRPGGYPPGPGRPSPSSGGDGLGPWAIALVLAALVAAIALVVGAIVLTRGDSAEEEVPLGGPATSGVAAPATAPTSVDPQAATKAEVVMAYRAAWDEFLAVARDPKATADDNRLRAHHTADSLATRQLALFKRKSGDEIYVGEVRLNPAVIELGSDTATIRDCVDDATGTVDVNTGEVVEPATRVIKTATVKMRLLGGIWKQANYASEETPCTPAGR